MRELSLDTKTMMQDKIFLNKAAWIALLVAVQGMLNAVMNLVDNLTIGSLGSTAIAPVGLANKTFFVYSLLVFGVVSRSGVLVVQHWGNGDMKNIRKALGLALMIALSVSLLFLIPARVNPQMMMRVFAINKASVRMGTSYLTVAALTYSFYAVTTTYVTMLRAVSRVKASMIISCFTIFINITFSYILIFGKFDAPVMGVVGAATAMLLIRAAETTAILCAVYLAKSPLACRVRELFGYSKTFSRQFFATALPVIANEFVWGLGTTIHSMAYGRMGDDAVTVITTATTIRDIVVALFQGPSAATVVVLGSELRAGRLKVAKRYAKSFFILQFLVTVTAALGCAGIRWGVIGLYRSGISDAVAMGASRCLIVLVCFMPSEMFNYVSIVDVLRSGDDARTCLFINANGVWIIRIPLAPIGGLVLHQPIYVVCGVVMLEEVYKMILRYWRYRRGRWLRNLVAEA